MYIDAKIGIPQEQLSAFKDMDVKAEEVFIEYPSSLSAGQVLKDADFKMEIYREVLSTHKGLSKEDIEYGSKILKDVYGNALEPLIHLNRNEYIGLFSNEYNRKIDELIKSRQLTPQVVPDYWPELNLVDPADKILLQKMFNITKAGIYNALNLHKLNQLVSFHDLYKRSLLDLCEENEFDCNNFNTIALIDSTGESGSIIRIINHKYINLSGISNVKDPKVREKYKKELKMMGSF